MLVIAHRGASGHRPENTMPAFEHAIALGADMIEIDLHRTRDGAIVVLHDDDLTGLGGRGLVGDASLEAVRALDAGDGECVPTLDEVLDRFGARIPFNLEIKRPDEAPYAGIEEAVLRAVESRGLLERTLLSCFDDDVLARLREGAPKARVALLVSRRTWGAAIDRARALGAEAINPWFGLVDATFVHQIHRAELAVYPYTVDDPAEIRRFQALGVDGLFTNFPDRCPGTRPRGETGSARRRN